MVIIFKILIKYLHFYKISISNTNTFFLFYRCFNVTAFDLRHKCMAGLRLLNTGSSTISEKWKWRGVDICSTGHEVRLCQKEALMCRRVCLLRHDEVTRRRERELSAQLCIPVTSRKPGGLIRDSVINRDNFRVGHS